jgi:integrase
MFCFAAYTGARRSEMLRSEIQDFDFRAGKAMIREEKRIKHRSSFRWVDLHPELTKAMTDWFARHPGGKYALMKDDRTRPVQEEPGVRIVVFRALWYKAAKKPGEMRLGWGKGFAGPLRATENKGLNAAHSALFTAV